MSEPDMEKLEALAGKVVGDVAGAMSLLMAFIGDKANVYSQMDAAGPCTLEELSDKIGINRIYLREWLGSNVAAGYVSYDRAAETYWLSPEQALVFTREGQPACMQGFIQGLMGQMESHEKATRTFISGEGRPWGDQTNCAIYGTDRFFKVGYDANLTENWLPSLAGMVERLEAGAKVADIGCGYGSSTVMMAKAYAKSTFVGIDPHQPSIQRAREQAEEAGVANVEFHVGTAQDFEGADFDLACIFDALHDMGDPVGAARQIRGAMKDDGTLMLVEPLAGDSLSDNLHPIGQIYYSFSTTMCTPNSLSQDVGYGLGAQAGQKRLTEVLTDAGFANVRRAAETPTNMVLEVTG